MHMKKERSWGGVANHEQPFNFSQTIFLRKERPTKLMDHCMRIQLFSFKMF